MCLRNTQTGSGRANSRTPPGRRLRFASIAPNTNQRNRLNDDKHRRIVLTLRLNQSEHETIMASARAAELPISTFVRCAALAAPITVRKYATLAPEDLSQLKRLGNLLNQIARAGWRGRFSAMTDEHLAAVLVELRIAFRKLSRPVHTP